MIQFKPNFFIVGASKAGTSALADALSQHPEIFMSKIKEPNFFNKFDSLASIISKDDLSEYSRYFEEVTDEKVIAEASVDYLPSKRSASWISKFNPQAKVLIIIRNPLERSRSMYEMYVRHGYRESFDHAIKVDGFLVKQNLYFDQVQRFFDCFPNNQVLIIEHRDLLDSWNGVTEKIMDFLEVDNKYPIHRVWKNVGGIPKNRFIRVLTSRSLVKILKKFVPKFMRNTIDKFMKENMYQKMVISQEQMAYLKSNYKNDVEKLSKLVDRDLVTCWFGK